MVGTTGWVLQNPYPENGYNVSSNAMKTIHDIKTIAKQYTLHKQKYAELKEGFPYNLFNLPHVFN